MAEYVRMIQKKLEKKENKHIKTILELIIGQSHKRVEKYIEYMLYIGLKIEF